MDDQHTLTHLHQLTERAPLNANGPLYIQLAHLLESAIYDGYFPAGFLPSEREIAKVMRVSRVTVCKALENLEKKKLILRQQGIGTRISSNALAPKRAAITPILYTRERATTKWLMRTKLRPTSVIAKHLEVPPCREVAYLQRLNLTNNAPISIENIYCPLDVMPQPELCFGSLQHYWQKCGYHLLNKHYQLYATHCEAKQASLLNIEEGTAVLELLETIRNKQNQVLQVTLATLIGSFSHSELA